MTRQELKSLEEEAFRQFKQKVAAWDTAGVIDQVAAKIDEALEEMDLDELKDRKQKALNTAVPLPRCEKRIGHSRWSVPR